MALSEAADLEAAILLAMKYAENVPPAPAPAPPAPSTSVAGYAFATDASGLQQAETYGDAVPVAARHDEGSNSSTGRASSCSCARRLPTRRTSRTASRSRRR